MAGLTVLALVLIAAALLWTTRGSPDTAIWRSWGRAIDAAGIRRAFATVWTDYPPGTFVILGAGQRIGGNTTDMVKALTAVGLAATATVMWVWFRDLTAVMVTIVALALNGLGLAALDLLFAPWLLVALLMLQRRRYAWFGFAYAAACCIKWQPLLIAPVLLIHLFGELRERPPGGRVRAWAATVLPAAAVAGAVLLVFGPTDVKRSLLRGLDHRFLSGYALNLGWVATAFTPHAGWWHGRVHYVEMSEATRWVAPGMRLLSLAATLVVLVAFWRGRRTFAQMLLACIATVLVYVACNVGVHENHLFLAGLVALPALWIVPRFRTELVAVIVLANVNLFAFYGPGVPHGWPRTIGRVDVTVPLAVVSLVVMSVIVIRVLPFLSSRTPEPAPDRLPTAA